jgi:hypothetical protein
MDKPQPEDSNEAEPKERRLPARLREISALASRLRLLLADAETGKNAPTREVHEWENEFQDTKKTGPLVTRRVMDPYWHETFVVVVTRLRMLLHLESAGPFEFEVGGDIEERWIGNGWALTRPRRMLRIAETLVADYCATFRERARPIGR